MTRHAEPETLSAYLDGELERAAAAGVETHLGECPECAARLEGLQDTVASLRRLERPPLPEAVTRGLRQRLERERRRPRSTAWLDALLPWRSLQPGMAAAALVIGALLFLVYGRYVQRPGEPQEVVFSAEPRAAPEDVAGRDDDRASPPAALSDTAPAEPAAPAAPPARSVAPEPERPAAPDPAAPAAERVAGAITEAAPVPEHEEVSSDAVAPAPEAPPAPPAVAPRREARSAAAELKAMGEMAGTPASDAAAGAPAPAAESEPLTLGPGIEEPVKIGGDELAFDRLRAARWPPRVLIEAVVTREGRVEDIRFVKPPDLDPRIADELRRTLATWRYRSATRDGQPVAVRLTITAHIHWR